MWTIRVKDRGRDLVTHQLQSIEEAHELQRVYELLGYPPERITVERDERLQREAA